MKTLQRGAAIVVLLFACFAMSYLIIRSSQSSYTSLFPGGHLPSSEVTEVRAYLEHFSIPFKEIKEKGICVHEEHVERIRMELAAAGIPKHGQGKGFELFDTNTWIKGEKELQVLEMRALKGQLEKDLAGFDQIQSASVILDMAPSRSFSNQKYPTKASVILTLMPGARLSTSQQRAITYHLAGAVRGLEPNMIAISDTKGRLYKALDPKGENDGISDAQLLLEEQIQEKIDMLLTRVVGKEHFHSTVQVILDPSTEEVSALILTAIIDQLLLTPERGGTFATEIERQLNAIVTGYGLEVKSVIDFVPFEKKRTLWSESKAKKGYTGLIVTAIFVCFAFLASIPLFRGKKKKKEDSGETLFKMMTKIDVERLANSIEGEDPGTVAAMLSYLEPARAEKVIASFSENFQDEVLLHLSKLENDT